MHALITQGEPNAAAEAVAFSAANEVKIFSWSALAIVADAIMVRCCLIIWSLPRLQFQYVNRYTVQSSFGGEAGFLKLSSH